MSLTMLLGPYRNLSTLTATALAFHPNVQVLNHAAKRLFADPALDFFRDPTDDAWRRFLVAALEASRDGQRGTYGGSILHAHAFDDPRVRQLYQVRFGEERMKAEPRALLWKDSMELQHRLASDAAQLPRLIDAFPDLRFLLPIRQPLDCALSNLRTGHSKFLMDTPAAFLSEVLDAVLASIVWALEAAERYPERFFVFTQHEHPVDLAGRLPPFLRVPDDDDWTEDFTSVFRPRPVTPPTAQDKRMEQERIDAALGRWPAIRDALLA